jgi:hypothetical protein
MTTRFITVLAVLMLPCIPAAEPLNILHTGELPSPGQEIPDSCGVDQMANILRNLTSSENESGISLPFDLDRLFSFSDLIDGFGFPGGLRFDIRFDRIGIGYDF